MAYTVGVNQKTVFGNMRVFFLSITADAATQTVVTPLSLIYGHSFAPQSLSTGAIKIYANSNASGVAANGSLGISGCTSGDVFTVIVYGR